MLPDWISNLQYCAVVLLLANITENPVFCKSLCTCMVAYSYSCWYSSPSTWSPSLISLYLLWNQLGLLSHIATDMYSSQFWRLEACVSAAGRFASHFTDTIFWLWGHFDTGQSWGKSCFVAFLLLEMPVPFGKLVNGVLLAWISYLSSLPYGWG